MCDLVVAITKRSLSGEWKRCGVLSSFNLGIGTRKPNKSLVKMIQPFAHSRWSVAFWICGNKHNFDLINNIGGQLFQSTGNTRHLKRTNVRTVGIAKEK